MNDPRYIPPSDREQWAADGHATRDKGGALTYVITNGVRVAKLLDHATFMDERDARQRDLIRRLAAIVAKRIGMAALGCGCRCVEYMAQCPYCENQERLKSIVAEARGVETTNE